LGRDNFKILFEPPLELPIKTLDVPLGGPGYGPKALPFVFDLVNLVNKAEAADASNRRIAKDNLPVDETGDETARYLSATRAVLRRVCSTHPSSLGLHPALYFYARSGAFQPGALFALIELFRGWETQQFVAFTTVREAFETFLLTHRGHTEAVRRLGSGSRSRPRLVAFYQRVLADLQAGRSSDEIAKALAAEDNFAFFITAPEDLLPMGDGSFTRDVKGAAFMQGALPSAPKCPTCRGFLHRNGMQVGHVQAKRDGGMGTLENSMMQHPFCNSTVAN
jgi:hypothetical protein